LSIAGIGCAVDLLTKRLIFGFLGMPGQKPHIWLWDEIFGLTTSLNEGALFGFGQGQVSLFTLLSVVAAVSICYWLFVAGAARDKLLTVALGCMMGGIFGNLYDRLGLPGLKWHENRLSHHVGEPVYAVRDWLHFQVQRVGFDWPVFNVADSLLVVGAGLLMWHALRTEKSAAVESVQKPVDA
jgi:signal peptidase II